MATFKIEDWHAGTYSRAVGLKGEQLSKLEAEIIEKLIAENLLPKGTFMVSVKLEVTCNIQQTAEEMKKPAWTFRTYEMEIKKEGELKEVKEGGLGGIKDVVDWKDKQE